MPDRDGRRAVCTGSRGSKGWQQVLGQLLRGLGTDLGFKGTAVDLPPSYLTAGLTGAGGSSVHVTGQVWGVGGSAQL